MIKKPLYINPINDSLWYWDDFRVFLKKQAHYTPIKKYESYKDVLLHIIQSLVLDKPIVLLDTDLNNSELMEKQFIEESVSLPIPKNYSYPDSLQQFLQDIKQNKSWAVSLFSSGTTGKPKKVIHTFESITKGAKISEAYKDHVWGWAYNPTHMAGTQVFFQSILNGNTLVQLFGLHRDEVLNAINKYQVTHLSATPTFLRLFINSKTNLGSLKNITCGGEKLNIELFDSLKEVAPNAKFRNIYASTEAGSLFSAGGEYFKISEKDQNKIKIQDQEIWLHRSIIGEGSELKINGDWYKTGDMVEFSDEDPSMFRFVSRIKEIINVGGYNVNPHEVEVILNKHSDILISRVYGKKNSVLGKIVVADVVLNSDSTEEAKLRSYLRDNLQDYKIPRIINFVKDIPKTPSGKTLRP